MFASEDRIIAREVKNLAGQFPLGSGCGRWNILLNSLVVLLSRSDVCLHGSGAGWTCLVFALVAIYMWENKNLTHVHATEVEHKWQRWKSPSALIPKPVSLTGPHHPGLKERQQQSTVGIRQSEEHFLCSLEVLHSDMQNVYPEQSLPSQRLQPPHVGKSDRHESPWYKL